MFLVLQNTTYVGIFFPRINKLPKELVVGGRTPTGSHPITNADYTLSFTNRTGIVVLNTLSHKALKPGRDDKGLGWWSWVRLQGHSGHILRIVSAYQPCYSSGPLSTYQQQVWHLALNKGTKSLKATFLTKLVTAIKQWQAEGNIVILMADMNKDVCSPIIKNTFRAVGLVEGLTSQHLRPPATNNQGSNPIDSIFVPITLLDQCQTGYLEFSEAVPSNHQALWLDINAQSVSPIEPETIKRPWAHWLQCCNPHVVQRYNMVLWEALQRDGIATRAQNLVAQVNKRLSMAQQEEFEVIDRAATKYKRDVEKQCRKIQAGAVPWCPQVSKAINRILYWKGLQNWLTGKTLAAQWSNNGQKKEALSTSPWTIS